MAKSAGNQELLQSLIALLGKNNREAATKRRQLIEVLNIVATAGARFILHYQDALLFLRSHPVNKNEYKLAGEGLEKIKAAVKKIVSSNSNRQMAVLNGSGIAGTELVCAYSYEIAVWLCNEIHAAVYLDSSTAQPDTISQVFQLILPAMEYQSVTQSGFSLLQRIFKITGIRNKSAALKWLLQTLGNQVKDEQYRSYLYSQLQVYIHWKPDDLFYNAGSLRSLPGKISYATGHSKSTGYQSLINKENPVERKLSADEKSSLLNTARASLALLCRETDPVSFGDVAATRYFEMGAGISIALYTMVPAKRFSIESYIGYMAFKNGVPVAYGGGWLFGARCKIGINIYPAFRYGNSALLFASILRLYRQQLGAKRFVVKPYQFGKGNPEGLRSGAFWFYYKLGFRPGEQHLRELANREMEKKQSMQGYRSSLQLLKQFTGTNMELVLDENARPTFDASLLSIAFTNYCNTHFDGNREKALLYCSGRLIKMAEKLLSVKLTNPQKKILEKQAPWYGLLYGNNEMAGQWPLKDQSAFIKLLLAKYGPDEWGYIKGMQQQRRLWKLLDTLQQAGLVSGGQP